MAESMKGNPLSKLLVAGGDNRLDYHSLRIGCSMR
jgi:hypothetical protein